MLTNMHTSVVLGCSSPPPFLSQTSSMKLLLLSNLGLLTRHSLFAINSWYYTTANHTVLSLLCQRYHTQREGIPNSFEESCRRQGVCSVHKKNPPQQLSPPSPHTHNLSHILSKRAQEMKVGEQNWKIRTGL